MTSALAQLSDLQGKVALVTGASRGIGSAIADALAAAGVRVFGTATGESGVTAIEERLRSAMHPGRALQLDVTDGAAVESTVRTIESEAGPIAILVNNAGITRDNLAIRMKDEEWDSVIDADLKSVFRLSKAVMRGMMKARFGRIINITSVVGSSGNPGQANYAAAKAGVAGMTRALSRELASRGVTVNCVAPGFIDTDMTRALSDAQRSALLQSIPASRLGSAEEVAYAVVFLATPGAGYINGTTIHVNGGMFMN